MCFATNAYPLLPYVDNLGPDIGDRKIMTIWSGVLTMVLSPYSPTVFYVVVFLVCNLEPTLISGPTLFGDRVQYIAL